MAKARTKNDEVLDQLDRLLAKVQEQREETARLRGEVRELQELVRERQVIRLKLTDGRTTEARA